jgi:hypothetical protein
MLELIGHQEAWHDSYSEKAESLSVERPYVNYEFIVHIEICSSHPTPKDILIPRSNVTQDIGEACLQSRAKRVGGVQKTSAKRGDKLLAPSPGQL